MTTTSPVPRHGSSLGLIAWMVGVAGAIAVLTLAGRGALAVPSVLDPGAWGAWAHGRDALTIAFAVLRLLTLALAWYLLGVTVIGAVARLARWRGVVAIADVLTVPAVRRLLQSALGLGLATAALTAGSPSGGPAVPNHPTPPTLTMTAEADLAVVTMTPLADRGETMTPVADVPVPPPAAEQRHWTVEPGDHFWSIAERVLAQAWGQSPTDAEIVAYSDELIAANESQLADPSNPDLILPGQRFTVPEPPRRP